MPIKKLVELNGEFGGWLEIDPVKLTRVATEFRNWLIKVNAADDEFGFLGKDLPLVEQALSGTLKMPCHDYPHNWEIRESLLPTDFRQISAPFYNTISGSLYSPPEVIMKDGRYFAWTEWED